MDGHRIPPPKDALSDERVRELVLAEVLMDTAQREVEARTWAPPRSASRGRIATSLMLTAIAAWLWVFPPAFLAPAPPSRPSYERVEAGLRVSLALQADRIERFRAENGRLPDQLREVGEPPTGVSYTRLDAQTYLLRGREGDTTIRWEGGVQSMELLMENALRTLREESE
jgi:hypothetical protein